MKRVLVLDAKFQGIHGAIPELHSWTLEPNEMKWKPKEVVYYIAEKFLAYGSHLIRIPFWPGALVTEFQDAFPFLDTLEFGNSVYLGSWISGSIHPRSGRMIIKSSELGLNVREDGSLELGNFEGLTKGRAIIVVLLGFDEFEANRIASMLSDK